MRSTLHSSAHSMAAMSDVQNPESFGAATGLVTVKQYQGIDGLGRRVQAFSCDALQFDFFLALTR